MKQAILDDERMMLVTQKIPHFTGMWDGLNNILCYVGVSMLHLLKKIQKAKKRICRK